MMKTDGNPRCTPNQLLNRLAETQKEPVNIDEDVEDYFTWLIGEQEGENDIDDSESDENFSSESTNH
jgi:hypothetical protein